MKVAPLSQKSAAAAMSDKHVSMKIRYIKGDGFYLSVNEVFYGIY